MMPTDPAVRTAPPGSRPEDGAIRTKWGFAFAVLRSPIAVASAFALLIGVYGAFRVVGYDIVPVLLNVLGLRSYPHKVDISGRWKYRCIALGTNYQHGGTCEVQQESTDFGIQWKLSGRRLWTGMCDPDGKCQVTTLNPPIYWETDWGIISGAASLKFTYSVGTSEGTVQGYATGAIELLDGHPSRIVGAFYQLPPFKPLHGSLEFRRCAGESDANW